MLLKRHSHEHNAYENIEHWFIKIYYFVILSTLWSYQFNCRHYSIVIVSHDGVELQLCSLLVVYQAMKIKKNESKTRINKRENQSSPKDDVECRNQSIYFEIILTMFWVLMCDNRLLPLRFLLEPSTNAIWPFGIHLVTQHTINILFLF